MKNSRGEYLCFLYGTYLHDGEGVRDGVVLLGDAEDGHVVDVQDGPDPLGGGRGGTPGRVIDREERPLGAAGMGGTDEAVVVAVGTTAGEEVVVVRYAIK
jgi:hypothetical protein